MACRRIVKLRRGLRLWPLVGPTRAYGPACVGHIDRASVCRTDARSWHSRMVQFRLIARRNPMSIGSRPPDTHRRLPARNTRTCWALGPEPGKSFEFWPPVQRPGLRWILAESIALVGRASKMPAGLPAHSNGTILLGSCTALGYREMHCHCWPPSGPRDWEDSACQPPSRPLHLSMPIEAPG
jgi:hypothetical protein